MHRSSPLPPRQILASVIAVIGCDGSGKSTLTADLVAHLRAQRPVKLLYLGQSSGRIGEAIQRLPLIGAPFGRYLARKAERTHSRKDTPPGLAAIVVIYLLSLWRAHKFRRMLALDRRGTLVIADRYPQAEVPGFHFDGPGLGAVITEGWLARKLAARELRLYQWMAGHAPALVIRLNIDAETAHARKPDHKLERLRAKVAVLPTLRFNGARILDLDGRDPYAQVLAAALRASHQAVASAGLSSAPQSR